MTIRATCPATTSLAPLPSEETLIQFQLDALIHDHQYDRALKLLDSHMGVVKRTPCLQMKEAELIIRQAQSKAGINQLILDKALQIIGTICVSNSNPEFLTAKCVIYMEIIRLENSNIAREMRKITKTEKMITKTPASRENLERKLNESSSKVRNSKARVKQHTEESQTLALSLNALVPKTNTVKTINKFFRLNELPPPSSQKMTPEICEFLIDDYMSNREYYSVIEFYNKYENILRSCHSCKTKYAYCLLYTGYINEAIKACDDVLKIEQFPYAMQCKISCLEKKERWSEAVKLNELLVHIAPDNHFSEKLQNKVLIKFEFEINKLIIKKDLVSAINKNNRLLEIFPNNQYSKNFIQKLKSDPKILKDEILNQLMSRNVSQAKELSKLLKKIETENPIITETNEADSQKGPTQDQDNSTLDEEKETGPSTPKSTGKPVWVQYSPPK